MRALMPEDAGAARALVSGQFQGTIYEARLLEQVEIALTFEDPEYLAVLAFSLQPRVVSGLVLFGAVAGARKVVKIHALVAESAGLLGELLGAVEQVAQGSRERMIVCEVPDDAPFGAATAALLAAGYLAEGRVADFVRDGVELQLLVWRADLFA